MALLISFLPILEFFSLIAPTMASLFILFGSFVNSDIKGLIYMAGLILSLGLGILLKPFFGGGTDLNTPTACNLFSDSFPNSQYSNPSLDTLSLCFTFSYIIVPMIYNKTLNWPIVVSLLFAVIVNGFFRIKLNCNKPMDFVLGTLIGVLCGAGYYSLVSAYGGQKYTLFSRTESNNVRCDKPSDQKFKCVVYKNGEVLKQL